LAGDKWPRHNSSMLLLVPVAKWLVRPFQA
jgi:hypothetical protein